MIIHLVRHGETAYNRDGLGLGRFDVPLTDLGERQAAAVGRRFLDVPLDAIFTSPLVRALSVARAIAGERPVAVQPRDELIEMDVGQTEGLTFAAMRECYPDFLKGWAGPDGHALPCRAGRASWMSTCGWPPS